MEWDALVEASATNTIFQTWEWFDGWWRVFGTGHRLFFLLLRSLRTGRAVGFAPLMISAGAGRRELRFAGTGNADYLDVVVSERHDEAIAALSQFLSANRQHWDVISLQNVPRESPLGALLPLTMRRFGLSAAVVGRVPCPVLLLDDAKAVGRMIDKYSLRRREHWFQRQGRLTFRRIEPGEETDRLLPVFFAQHIERWRDSSAPSLFNDPRQQQLYRELAATLGRKGWLAFSVLELDDAPIAFHFGFEYQHKLLWYKPSYAPEQGAHSPGLVLIRRLVLDALKAGHTEVDFTVGDEPFKSRFANHRRSNINIRVFKNRTLFVAAVLSYHSRQFAKRALASMRGLVGRRGGMMSVPVADSNA